jgi:tetratricopeptide (TPR) repeat protein
MSAGEPDALLERARSLLAAGKPEEARSCAKACLKLRLGDEGALLLLDEIDLALEGQVLEDPKPATAADRVDRGDRGDRGDPEAWTIGQLILGEYTLERKLGEGGMGVVYLARSQDGRPFAVKTIHTSSVGEESHRQAFLKELSTWLALPEHPNLAACRFFRTTGDRVVIFADLVDGGSLQQAIAEGRVRTLESALDAAIQSAWGLAAAHLAGAIHQDVKPSNMLMSSDGTLKVSDFGLARARPAQTLTPDTGADLTVTCAGMSAAYCSPEQAAGKPLSLQTDVWSWGVAVLEIFAGRCPCRYGPHAPESLEALVRGELASVLVMPDAVASVLRRCFRSVPSERWGSMLDAAASLVQLYEPLTGRPYPRAEPVQTGGDDPGGTRRAEQAGAALQARSAARLATFEHLILRLEQALHSGDTRASEELGVLYRDRGMVHVEAHDWSGGESCFLRAAALLEPLVVLEGRADLARALGVCLVNAGICRRAQGDLGSALQLQSRAIALWEPIVQGGGRPDLAERLASTLHNQCVATREVGDLDEALALSGRAIALLEPLSADGPQSAREALAAALGARGLVLRDLGDLTGAVEAQERAIQAHEALSLEPGFDARNGLAMACMNQAMALRDMGDVVPAVARCHQAVSIREQLVLVEGKADLLDDLALAYASLATLQADAGDHAAQVATSGKAVALWERLVHQQGRWDLAPGLALAHTNLADSLRYLGDLRAALAASDRAISLLERILQRGERSDVESSLAITRINKAIALLLVQEPGQARSLCDENIARIEARLAEGQEGLLGVLAWAQVVRAEAREALGDLDGAKADATNALSTLSIESARTGRADLQQIHAYAARRFAALLSHVTC